MPGMGGALENQAAVADCVGRNGRIEGIEFGCRLAVHSAVVVEDQRLPPPFGFPVCVGVEVENVRADLGPAVAVRVYGAAVGCVVPVE